MPVLILDCQAPDFPAQLVKACRDVGAVMLVNHGIPESLIKAAYDDWKPESGGFFSLPEAEKRKFLFSDLSPQHDDPEIGFYPFGSEKGSDHDAKNKGSVNLNEYYHIKTGIAGSYPTTGSFRATKMLALANEALVRRVLDILEAGGPSKADAPHFGNLAASLSADKWSTFRWLHYPPVPMDGDDTERQLIKVHKDKGCVTTVVAPSQAGLAVQDRNGDYHRVPHRPDGIILQIGEGLELMSNGYYFAGRHTVMGRPSQMQNPRTSAARFWHFTPETRLTAEITNGDMMSKYWEKKDLKVA